MRKLIKKPAIYQQHGCANPLSYPPLTKSQNEWLQCSVWDSLLIAAQAEKCPFKLELHKAFQCYCETDISYSESTLTAPIQDSASQAPTAIIKVPDIRFSNLTLCLFISKCRSALPPLA